MKLFSQENANSGARDLAENQLTASPPKVLSGDTIAFQDIMNNSKLMDQKYMELERRALDTQ